jgi:hypothetical protein
MTSMSNDGRTSRTVLFEITRCNVARRLQELILQGLAGGADPELLVDGRKSQPSEGVLG